MAKRLKLDTLANTQEVEKLQELNQGMSEALKTKDASSNDKLQKYEELLAEYKQVLDDFAREQSRKLNMGKEDVKDKITSILQNEGVIFKDTKVHFPLEYNDRKRKKKSTTTYSKKSYENAVQFLTSKQAAVAQRRTKRMAEKVYPYLKNSSVNFTQYPNFSILTNDRVARFSGKWSRL
jgi:hypothetical protein